MKRIRFILLTIFATFLLTTAVASNSTVDDDEEDEDPTTTKPISSSVQLSSSMSESSAWTSSVQNTPSLNPSISMEPNTYTVSISASSSDSISPTSSSSFSTSSTYPGWIKYPSSSNSTWASSSSLYPNTQDWGKQVSSSSSSYPGWINYPSSSWSINPSSSSSHRNEYPYTQYYAPSNNYAYPNTYNPNTYIKPTSSYNPSTYSYGINPSRVMDSMMRPVTGAPQKYENFGGPPSFPFPGGEGRFPHPGFPMGPANYNMPFPGFNGGFPMQHPVFPIDPANYNMPFPGFNGGFPMQHPVFPIDPANYQRETCEETLKNLAECCEMPKNIFKEEDLEKCKTSQPDIKSEICIKSCVLSNNNMYTSENKLNQMKVVEYFVSNTNFDETWKPIVKRAAYDCVSTINGKFTASVSGPTNCNMIADYLDSCVKSYFVKSCPQNKQPATLVATTCSKKLAIAARCDPFAMNEARKMSNIAVPQHNTGPFPGMIMNPITTVDNPNIAVMPPHFPPHFPMGQPLPQIIMPGPNFAMPEPTRDCWKSLQMLPPNCCNRPILIPESEFKACENLPQGATDSSTTDDTADNPNWCQMECVFKNRNWLKDKVIDKEMVSTLVAKVTDTTWQPVVKDAFFSKCFAKISEPSKADHKKCNPDPYNLMTCVDRELVLNCAKKSTDEVSIALYDKCKFSISQVENCDLSGKPGGIPMAAEANPNESNNKKKDETKHIIHHRVGGGSGIMGSLANGVAAGVGAGVANGVVSQIFNKGSNNGGQAQGAPQYAMPGQGMQNQGGYGMQNQGGYGMPNQGGYSMQGQGGYGMSNQGANGMQSQGGYGQGAQQQYGQPGPVKQAVPMQNSQPGQGNNPKKKGTFAEAAKKVVQNKKQVANQKQASNTATNQKQASNTATNQKQASNTATNQKQASNTATNKKQAVPQKTSDSKNTQKNSGSKKSSGGFFSKLSSKLGGGSSRRSGGGGRRG